MVNAPSQAKSGDSFITAPGKSTGSREKANNVSSTEKPTTFSRAVYPRKYYLNKDYERLDDSFPEPSGGQWASFNQRLKHYKVCNDYTLLGHCNNKQCVFAHVSDLSSGEIHALAKRARLAACAAGSACRSFVCWYGHVCPNGQDCPRGNKCFFKKVHGKDTDPCLEVVPPPVSPSKPLHSGH